VIRVEHWATASEQGVAAARNLLAEPADRVPYEAVPYFWSDHYDVKIQALGLPGRGERFEILEGGDDAFVAAGVRGDRVVAVVAFNAPRRLAFYRPRLAAMPAVSELTAAVAADDRALATAS